MSDMMDSSVNANRRSSDVRPVPVASQSNPSFDLSFTPSKFDVLAGRGGNCYNHPGNLFYRELIESSLPRYVLATTKHARGTIVTSIVETICNSSPNGFLRFNNKNRTWTKLTEYEARQKVGQTIREALTRRDVIKREANRDRRASNKAKRSAKGSEEEDSQPHQQVEKKAKYDPPPSQPKPTPPPPPPSPPKPVVIPPRIPTPISKPPSAPKAKAENPPSLSASVASPVIGSPSDRDVLCGRGTDYYQHEGNQFFRKLINATLQRYTEANTKHAKSSIVTSIYYTIRNASPHGFVRYDEKAERWLQLTEYEARQKVGQTIRETLTQRDPIKRAKNRDKRASNKLRRKSQTDDNQPLSGGEGSNSSQPIQSACSERQDAENLLGVSRAAVEMPPSEAAAAASAREIHPLESILVAMSVKRQQQEIERESHIRAMQVQGMAAEARLLSMQMQDMAAIPPCTTAAAPPLRDRYLAIIAATTKELNSQSGSNVAHL